MGQTPRKPTKEKTGSVEKTNQKDSYRVKRNVWQPKNHKKSFRSKGLRTVARIMKDGDIRSKTKKKYKATTNSKHHWPVYLNLLNQQFEADEPNQVWVADITYIWTKEGWLYLASIMDLFSRKIVGWYLSERMTKELSVHPSAKSSTWSDSPFGPRGAACIE